MKSPGGKCPVRVNVWDHLLNVLHHALLVGQDGTNDSAAIGYSTPLIGDSGYDKVSQLAKGNLVLDRWDIVEFFPS